MVASHTKHNQKQSYYYLFHNVPPLGFICSSKKEENGFILILFKNLQFILILFEKSRLELPEQKEKASQVAPIEFDCNFLFKLRFIEKKKALRRLQLLMTQCGGGGGGGGVILPVISKTYKSFLRGISLPCVPHDSWVISIAYRHFLLLFFS